MLNVTTHQPQAISAAGAAGASKVFEFGRDGGTPCAGWFLSLALTGKTTNSRVQVVIEGWDGLGQSSREQFAIFGNADLIQSLTRVFVPFAAARVTFENVGTDVAVVAARGVQVELGSSWPRARYLYNAGTEASVGGAGTFVEFAVPDGAVAYRPRWTHDLGQFSIEERPASTGSASAAFKATTAEQDSREWIPLSMDQTPGGTRQIALGQSSGTARTAAVEFQIDLWGGG